MTEGIPSEDFGGGGQLLHFAHANAYPPRTYRAFLGLLSNSFRVLAIKHRPLWGHARSTDLISWDQIAQDIITFCDQNKLHGIIGIGHSLGSVTTMMAAHERPDLFRTLVLIEPVFLPPAVLSQLEGGDMDGRTHWPWVAAALKRRNHWSSRSEAFNHFRRKKVFSRWSDEVLSDYINSGLRINKEGNFELTYPREWEARIYALPPTDVWNIIPKIKQPTLAIRGFDSETLGAAAWSLWQTSQPQATFIELPRSGHLVPMERPGYLAEVILDFLSKSTRKRSRGR